MGSRLSCVSILPSSTQPHSPISFSLFRRIEPEQERCWEEKEREKREAKGAIYSPFVLLTPKSRYGRSTGSTKSRETVRRTRLRYFESGWCFCVADAGHNHTLHTNTYTHSLHFHEQTLTQALVTHPVVERLSRDGLMTKVFPVITGRRKTGRRQLHAMRTTGDESFYHSQPLFMKRNGLRQVFARITS